MLGCFSPATAALLLHERFRYGPNNFKLQHQEAYKALLDESAGRYRYTHCKKIIATVAILGASGLTIEEEGIYSKLAKLIDFTQTKSPLYSFNSM